MPAKGKFVQNPLDSDLLSLIPIALQIRLRFILLILNRCEYCEYTKLKPVEFPPRASGVTAKGMRSSLNVLSNQEIATQSFSGGTRITVTTSDLHVLDSESST